MPAREEWSRRPRAGGGRGRRADAGDAGPGTGGPGGPGPGEEGADPVGAGSCWGGRGAGLRDAEGGRGVEDGWAAPCGGQTASVPT